MIHACLLAFAFLFSVQSPTPAPGPAQAQTPAKPPAPVPSITDAVFVSASLVDLPLSRVTDTVTVITAADLRERQAESIADALRAVTGLGVTASGGRGAVTSIFTRGGESDYTLVVVDGIPINEFGGSIDLAHLSTAGVDRIEIVRGPQSAVHGSGAIAGVIQIVTADGGPSELLGQIEVGSESFSRALAHTRGTAGGWSFGGGVDGLDTAGFTGNSVAGPVSNDGYRRLEMSAAVARSLPAASRIRVAARVNDYARGFPGPYGSNPAGNYGGIDTVSRGENTVGSISAVYDAVTGAVAHRVTGGWMRREGTFASPFGDSDSFSRRSAIRYVADWRAPGATGLSAGAEVARESGGSTFIVNRAEDAIPVERTIAGYFAEARGTAGARLIYTAGGRIDQIHRNALSGDASPFGARPDMAADTVWAFNPRVSAVFYLSSPASRHATRLRAGFSTGIKPPSAFELSSTDNPALQPERNRSGEIALEQMLRGGAVSVAATAFWNRYDDLIITVGRSLAGASQYRSDNLSNSRAQGLELSVDARLTNGFALRGGYTWLETEILAADDVRETGLSPFVVGDRLLRRPRHRGFFDVSYSHPRAAAFLAVENRGATLDVEPSFGLFGGLFDNEGYSTTSAGASWNVARPLTLFGRVTNLFDREYEEIFGFPAPGRRVTGGVRVTAGR
ncbi:MAG: TonB-dependent receptor [Vicinamibacterales bacterium]